MEYISPHYFNTNNNLPDNKKNQTDINKQIDINNQIDNILNNEQNASQKEFIESIQDEQSKSLQDEKDKYLQEEKKRIEYENKIKKHNQQKIDIEFKKQKNDLINLIFEGYTFSAITYKGFNIVLRGATPAEAEQAYHDASFYEEDFFYAAYRLFILSMTIQSIDDYVFSGQKECYLFLQQLSLKVIADIYELFVKNVEYQNRLVANADSIYQLVEDNFCRMKFKVMRAFHCLPTEERCKQMSDVQWLWLYYNLEEDLLEKFDNTQDNLDYIGFYINSDAAKQITKNSAERRKKRSEKRKKQFKKISNRDRDIIIKQLNDTGQLITKNEINTVHEENTKFNNAETNIKVKDDKKIDNEVINKKEANTNKKTDINKKDIYLDDNSQEEATSELLDHFFNSVVTDNPNSTYNTEFEKELAAALGTTNIDDVAIISDDDMAGDPYESEEDFLARVAQFAQYAGTDYGYVKPEKPKLAPVKRTAAYIARPNVGDGEYIPGYDLENTPQGKIKHIAEQQGNNNFISTNKPNDTIETKTLQQRQSDLEFMRKMHIHNLNDIDKYKDINENNKDLDYFGDID